MDSHYTRKNTSKQYLATDLSIKQCGIYTALYVAGPRGAIGRAPDS